MDRLYFFLYLDCDNIDQLYSQVFGNMTEQSVTQSSKEKFDSSVNANLLSVLGSNIEGQSSNLVSVNTTYSLTASQKATQLIERFRNEKTSIQDIILKNQTKEDNIFFVGKATFFLRDICDAETGISQLGDGHEFVRLTDNSLIMLESGNTTFIKEFSSTYMDSDDYYAINMSKMSRYGILMSLSNSKIKKNIRHLNNQIIRGKHNNFYVFGQLLKMSSELYSINPFAVWQ